MVKRRFKTDKQLTVCMKRLDDGAYSLVRKYTKLFKACGFPKTGSLCGNVRVSFVDGIAKLTDYSNTKYTFNNNGAVASYEQISSPLALYRAISVFKTGVNAKRQDFYKTNWEVVLKHKKTGQYLMLGEWKGGFQIFTSGHKVDALPIEFIKDVEAFLTWFVSKEVPIGYDGVVAGSVA